MPRVFSPSLCALVMCASVSFGVAGPAVRIDLVLPGQTFVPGTGVIGTPDPVNQRRRFVVEAYAVDALGNIDFGYEGTIEGIGVALDAPPPGEPPLPAPRRFGTTLSGAGAATSVAAGNLRISLGGSDFVPIPHAGASTPQGVCNAIEAGIASVDPSLFSVGSLDIKCRAAGGRYRFFALVDRSNLSQLLDLDIARSIEFDPNSLSAPLLKLGAIADPNAPFDPNTPAVYAPRNVEPAVAADLRFSRGAAVFEISAMHVSGPGTTLQVFQGAGGLPVVASSFTVFPVHMTLESALLLDTDHDGGIETALITFSEPIDPLFSIDPIDFTMTRPGLPWFEGTSVTVSPFNVLGYNSSQIEVKFGSGIGKTDVKDVEVAYSSPSGIRGAQSGTVVVGFSLFDTSVDPADVRLIDSAPPVLLNTFVEDTDGNDAVDTLTFFFSEPLAFSAGHGAAFSPLLDPALDPNTMEFPAPSSLRLTLSGLTALEQEIVVDPVDPNEPFIVGAESLALAMTDAIRRNGPPVPPWANGSAAFVDGRYILRSGVSGVVSGVGVHPANMPPDLAQLARLGPVNGGVERPGHGRGVADLDSLVVRGQDGSNLLLGKSSSDVVIAGNSIDVNLTNVPGSGTATPTWIWRDDGDRGFITDKALVPNHAEGMNNVGLHVHFNPKELLVAASSTSGPDGTLRLTKQPGTVTLDASQSSLPLTSVDDDVLKTFTWTQVSGPFIPGGVPPNDGVVTFTPTLPGIYEFDLELTVPDPTGNAFNPYLDNDRTLRRRLEMTVTTGPQDDVVILLPGQTLNPGALSASAAVTGTPRVATEEVPYEFYIVATDAFYNEVTPPLGAMARVATTDPLDEESPFQAFTGSRVRVRITPSDSATTIHPELDDEVLVAFEHGDIHFPYVVGSLWNVTATPVTDSTGHVKVKFVWLPDPRAIQWNIYRSTASALRDLNHDGISDLGYGSCVTSMDPDPSDAEFEDGEDPPLRGIFIYLGSMKMAAFGMMQETSLGMAKNGNTRRERPNFTPCTPSGMSPFDRHRIVR